MRAKNITYLFLFLGISLFSQTYNNEWINFGQRYYKINIAKDGLYRLDSASLVNAGIPVSTFSPKNIQLFQRGHEIYPYIFGEGDDTLNTNDYILFYAAKNSGKDDSLLYDHVPYVTNPYYSVINDTGAVFLTWNNQTNNHRLTLNTDTTFSQYNPSPYYYKESVTVIDKTTANPNYPSYSLGPLNFVNQDDPRYKLGEGFFHYQIGQLGVDTLGFNSSFVYKSVPPAYFSVSVSGANDIGGITYDHYLHIDYLDNNGNPQVLLPIDSLMGYQTYRYNYTVIPSSFGNFTTIRASLLYNANTASVGDLININYIQALYPQQFNMLGVNQEKMYLPNDGTQSKSKLVLSNFNSSASPPPVMVDTTNKNIYFLPQVNGKFTALVPNSISNNKFCFLTSQSNITNVSTIKAVNGSGYFTEYQSLPDSVYIIVSHPSLNSSVAQYETFRNSPVGGSFSVINASINDLYDQFAFGVELSPLSIRNFCKYVINHTNKKPSNLFLIGKSIHPKDCIAGTTISQSPPYSNGAYYASQCLVPTFGNPSSDVLLTQGLPGSINLEPAIPTGRLAAKTNADVLAYLSKAQKFEQQKQIPNNDSLWMKRAIHFVGGDDYNQQQVLQSFMAPCQSTYQDTLIGGKVFSFFKTTTAPVSTTTNDSVAQLINSGVSLMTFFGHGSQTGFDQNIDDPSTYNNSPRFPIIIANSCYTGDIHSGDQQSHSELWSMAPNDHGCVEYIATVSEGVANDLASYTQELYRQFSYKSYGQSYGNCIKNNIRKLMIDAANNIYGNDSIIKITALEMTLQGDPALEPYSFAKPDYAVTNTSVIFNTTKYPADSIGLKIIMSNLGRAVKDSFTVLVRRNFPNGDSTIWYKRVKGPLYVDTLSFFIPLDYYRAVGINTFYVDLNYLHVGVQETNYTNNSTGNIALFIKGADIEPVWPYKCAIVPNITNVILKASTADPFAPTTLYRFQVDTNDSYQSMLVNTTVSAPGGVVTLPVTLYNKDSVVYYWRVAKDTSGTPNWKESSFQVLMGKYGWGQAHFNQFKNDNYQYVNYNKPGRNFTFVNNTKSIQVNDLYDKGPSYLSYTKTQFFYNNAQQRLWSCAPDGWTIAVFDTIAGNLMISDTLGGSLLAGTELGSYGNCICDPNTPLTAFDFGRQASQNCGDTSDWRPKLVNFINAIPNRYYVLAYSVKLDIYNDPITPSMLSAFHSIGSSQIDNLTDTTLLIIFGRKTQGSSAGQAHEVLSTNTDQLLTLKDSIKTEFTNGFIASEIIGPCRKTDTAWHSLHWHYMDLPTDQSPSDDRITLQVVGIDTIGNKTPLVTFPKDSLNVLDLARYANGKRYPYLQLIAYEADSINHTPPQLKRWQVIFDQVPEAAIHPPAGYSVVKSAVAEGEVFEVHMPIENISDFAFTDSLAVTYYVQDPNRNIHYLPYKLKKKPFLPGAIMIDTARINTVDPLHGNSLGYAGSDILWIDVNPPAKPKYQLEQFHFNNIASVAFSVAKDKINPLLDVTFDGVHILNGDIVSAKPNVLVTLKDENKFLALNDTSNFMVYVLQPGSSSEQRLFFSNSLQFIPAQLPNNSCKINYHPTLTQDGIYTLHVKSTDRSGNISGQYDYRIQFDVINKPMITDVLNYPNPFSTSTKFVFTITGSDVPETFKIQILTVSGRVVKEVTREELGFLHIGRNITDYAWDGTDQFGDKLANGVYLYRVQTRLHGDDIDHLNTAADTYFKKGYGKMLLMR